MGIIYAAVTDALDGHPLTAVCDTETRLTSPAKKLLPSAHFYQDLKRMVENEELDGVFICTSASTHSAIVTQITTRKPHTALFVEKPLAPSFRWTHSKVETLHPSRQVTMVGFQRRFAGVFRRAKFVLDEALGRLLFFRSHHYSSGVLARRAGWKFQKGDGGVTPEFGVHLLNLIH